MVFNLKPGLSVGIVDLGEDRNTVRQKLNMPYREDVSEFMETKEYLDMFGENDIKAIYEEDKLVAIEFYDGEVLFNEIDVFNTDVRVLLSELKKTDAAIEITDAEFTSKAGIMGIYDDEEELLSSIMICTKEYCIRPVKEYTTAEIEQWLTSEKGQDFLKKVNN